MKIQKTNKENLVQTKKKKRKIKKIESIFFFEMQL